MWAKIISLGFGFAFLCFVAVHQAFTPKETAAAPSMSATEAYMAEEAVIERYSDMKILEVREHPILPDTTEYPSFRAACTMLEMTPHQLSRAIEECQLVEGTCFLLERTDQR